MLRMHASSCVEDIRVDAAISVEQQFTRIPILDMLPHYSSSDVSMTGVAYGIPERHRIEGSGLACGNASLVKVVALAGDAAVHVMNDACIG
jgi:hypothetical protein